MLAGLLAELEPMATEIVERTRAEIPSLRSVPLAEHLSDTSGSLRLLIDGALGDEGPDGAARQRLRAIGSRRAGQGVPVEDLMRSWRLSIRLGTERATTIARRRGIPAELVLGAFNGAHRLADQAMVTLAEAHRSRERSPASHGARGRFVRAALSGRIAADAIRAEAVQHGIALDRRYRAVRVRGERHMLLAVEARLTDVPGSGEVVGGLFAEPDEGEMIGFTSLEPGRGSGELIAVGPSLGIESLAASFRVATRVVNVAERFGLAGVHDLGSAGLHVAVLESGDAGDALVERYIEPVRDSPSGEALLASLRVWLESGKRVDPAAERLHVHPNTLRYRLARYAELTGADLGVTEELVGVWWALQRELVAAA